MKYEGKWLEWIGSYGLVVFYLILIAAISLSAQLPTGTILGTVKDQSGVWCLALR